MSFLKDKQGIKDALEKEQRKILFHKKGRKAEAEYFNLLRFFFSSPDKI